MTYGELRERNPQVRLKFGLMELFAQQCDVFSIDAAMLTERREVVYPPLLLARANASCTHAALERSPGCSIATIEKLSNSRDFVFINEAPDSAAANTRRKAFLAHQLRPLRNTLYNPTGRPGSAVRCALPPTRLWIRKPTILMAYAASADPLLTTRGGLELPDEEMPRSTVTM